MGFFTKIIKSSKPEQAHSDNDIVAVCDAKLADITTVPDEMFSKKLLGDGIVFNNNEESVMVCAPANGTLTALFPTGHAFGITMNNGAELLVHIGIDTVNENGNGFVIQNVKQGQKITAGTPIVKANLHLLGEKYYTGIMLVITNSNNLDISLRKDGDIVATEKIN